MSFCHWNPNSIPIHNFILSPLCAHISINKFDFVCFSYTYLDSTVSSNDGNFKVPGYTSVCAGNPVNTKWGDVGIYYLNSYHWKY